MKSKLNIRKAQQNETMLKKKTNQDFNDQKPDPKDPNMFVNHQIGEEEAEEYKKKEVVAELSENKTESGNSDSSQMYSNPQNFEEENENVDNDKNITAEFTNDSENKDFVAERE